jgi:hypothetical protein
LSVTVIGSVTVVPPVLVTRKLYGMTTLAATKLVVVVDLTMASCDVPTLMGATAVLFEIFGSLVAPVVPLTVNVPPVVGVPVTVHEMREAGATVVGGVGVHVVVRPEGKPVTAQEAAVAATAGGAALVHVYVPEYGWPIAAEGGNPASEIVISEPVTAMAAVVVLLPPVVVPPLVSLVAPVVAVTVTEPVAVGVPATSQEMVLPAARVTGGVGVQAVTLTPGGRPVTLQVAAMALAVALALLVQVTVPA